MELLDWLWVIIYHYLSCNLPLQYMASRRRQIGSVWCEIQAEADVDLVISTVSDAMSCQRGADAVCRANARGLCEREEKRRSGRDLSSESGARQDPVTWSHWRSINLINHLTRFWRGTCECLRRVKNHTCDGVTRKRERPEESSWWNRCEHVLSIQSRFYTFMMRCHTNSITEVIRTSFTGMLSEFLTFWLNKSGAVH